MKKTFIPLFLAACFSLASCSKSEEAKTEASAAVETEASLSDSTATSESPAAEEVATAETASAGSAEDCDKFLTDYEEFATSYAALSAKFAQNPSDMSIMTEYGEMATKAQEMQTNRPDACQSNAAFLKRYTSIAAKVSKAAAAQAAGSAKLMEQMAKMSQ